MKPITTTSLVIVALLLTTPGQTYPQWLPIDADRDAQIDFNSIADHGKGVRSVTLSFRDINTAGTMVIHCPSWQVSITEAAGLPVDKPWERIPAGTNVEMVAYAICPGPMRTAALRFLQRQRGPQLMPEPEGPSPMWPARPAFNF